MPRSTLSQAEVAQRAHVSQPAVHRAIRAGHLNIDDDGKVLADDPRNRRWIARHAEGLDQRARPLSTYSRGTNRNLHAGSQPPSDDGDEAPLVFDPKIEEFAESVLAEIAAEQSLRGDRALALLTEIRDGVRRTHERLNELNLRLRIARDPFQRFTVEGARLVAKDEAERKASPAPARERGSPGGKR